MTSHKIFAGGPSGVEAVLHCKKCGDVLLSDYEERRCKILDTQCGLGIAMTQDRTPSTEAWFPNGASAEEWAEAWSCSWQGATEGMSLAQLLVAYAAQVSADAAKTEDRQRVANALGYTCKLEDVPHPEDDIEPCAALLAAVRAEERKASADAVKAERERCRQAVFDRHMDVSSDFDEGYDSAVADIVEAIDALTDEGDEP